MSAVPVFADGLSAPTLTASVNGSTVSLTWNTPLGTTSFMIRRGTTAAPAITTDGTLVATSSLNAFQDTNIVDGTYYYSIFGHNGVIYSHAGTNGPLTIHTPSGTSAAVKMLRMQNGLDSRGYPLSSSSSSLFSSTATLSSSSERGIVTSSSSSAQKSSTVSVHQAAPKSPQQTRICERVLKWFSGNAKMMRIVNERLTKRFGFGCEE